ncbi:putative methyltransferase [Rhizoctonia solani 123E]|uniref:Putative methyltransferase n=1 Tax=Rhizoctonia solani 123E TaxID=1423351 RepID=A0A074S598_9AGAM|nr:putative methyltransferase [Rhizoctonia solani 123E]
MFEYLSFLRPPPEACLLGQPVTFVPQIANDLRTEPCETQHNIYFAWKSESGALDRTGFAKLTTWRPGSGSYKPLSVALPSEARAGDAWRLCLAVDVDSKKLPQALVLDLVQNEFGRLPFPVTSLPINVLAGESAGSTGKARGNKSISNKQPKAKSKPTETNISKQEKIERFYLLPFNRETLRITEQTSFDLDKKIWDSGVAVSSWLAKLLTSSDSPGRSRELIEHFRMRLQVIRDRNRALQIVELGTGTGLVSLVLGALLAQRRSSDDRVEDSGPVMHARILATDLSSALELIDHNKAANSHLIDGNTSGFEGAEETRRTCEIELHAAELDWDSPIPSSVWPKDHSSGAQYPFDIIIMADVTYNTASFGALLDTVTGLLRGPSAPGLSAVVLLAYKSRDPAERTLWIDAQRRGIVFVLVDTVKGVQEPAVEIWLGGWERDVKSIWSDAH